MYKWIDGIGPHHWLLPQGQKPCLEVGRQSQVKWVKVLIEKALRWVIDGSIEVIDGECWEA